jgi:hypothetical protein
LKKLEARVGFELSIPTDSTQVTGEIRQGAGGNMSQELAVERTVLAQAYNQ